MRYSNAGEIAVITIVWAVILLLVKSAFDVPAKELQQPEFSKPQIMLVLRYVGCTKQEQEVIKVLSSLPWLEPASIERDEVMAVNPHAAGTPPPTAPAPHATTHGGTEELVDTCTIRIVAGVKDTAQADFIQLTNVLRDIGVVPAVLMFGGLSRFSLQAQMTSMSMSCIPCVQTALEALKPLPVSAAYYYSTTKNPIEVSKHTTFEWLDAKHVDEKQNTITVSVRPNNTARVGELIRALERIGLFPTAVRIVTAKA
jgi:hypothetical protein